MGKTIKTNALRILDKNKISYEAKDSIDLSDSNNPDVDASLIHKTLVARGVSNELYVFIIPLNNELDLKKAASAAQEKKILMLPEKELLPNTGYIKGGCSPIGMKKLYKTFLELSSSKMEQVIVSGGKVKFRVKLKPGDLMQVVNAEAVDLIK
ncbi:aminoacyl-tRNA deacylase [Ancylomarina euxinus]|uniref:Cys-tRNA(Pro)/Cys-tRNA(Cys) deacylase n=1 Tax=Ancylomarina euxinus TaxID=2283627 RepID=A0A425XYB2_9BACT|nr:aminoacyl-tRNA deacylase [Ancylomarina euxinus]MCZ4695823.1 aminoacyl-tRNA deacylase [Ancylomarina euxinus]MUP16112.1 Cys-tRNA(Pro) deacylase [Ancylomarina euxinus]RRG19833.1 aminoacyl-tRNA deacylase [Ancylomarina euxinus]